MVCYLSQQCVEKLIKGLLIQHGVRFPKTHNLEDLYRLLHPVCPEWKADEDDLLLLTRASLEFRYPGEDATEEDARHAYELCRNIWSDLSRYFEEPPNNTG